MGGEGLQLYCLFFVGGVCLEILYCGGQFAFFNFNYLLDLYKKRKESEKEKKKSG